MKILILESSFEQSMFEIGTNRWNSKMESPIKMDVLYPYVEQREKSTWFANQKKIQIEYVHHDIVAIMRNN